MLLRLWSSPISHFCIKKGVKQPRNNEFCLLSPRGHAERQLTLSDFGLKLDHMDEFRLKLDAPKVTAAPRVTAAPMVTRTSDPKLPFKADPTSRTATTRAEERDEALQQRPRVVAEVRRFGQSGVAAEARQQSPREAIEEEI